MIVHRGKIIPQLLKASRMDDEGYMQKNCADLLVSLIEHLVWMKSWAWLSILAMCSNLMVSRRRN